MYIFDFVKHFGLKYKCPICGYHSHDLMPIGNDLPVIKEKHIIGAGLRKGGCYKCGALDRFKLIYTFLKYELNIFKDKSKKILHFAPETIIAQKFIEANFQNYIQADFFAEDQHCEYNDNVKHMDVQNIPYTDNTFDLILCNHILEHVPNDQKALQEIYRVLKKDGLAILQVPISKTESKTLENLNVTSEQERERLFGQKDHVRLYGQDYIYRLETAGFKVQSLNLFPKYPKFGLNPEEKLFICTK